MRPKVVVGLMLLAMGLIISALVIRGLTRGHLPSPLANVTPLPPEIVARGKASHWQVGGSPLIPKESAVNAAMDEQAARNSVVAKDPVQEHADQIRDDLERINGAIWSGKEDPQAVNTILDLLVNPEPAVRKAALSAVAYFDVPVAINRLKELANQQEDPREKVAILDTLELMMPVPSPSEGMTNVAPGDLPQEVGRIATEPRPAGTLPSPVRPF